MTTKLTAFLNRLRTLRRTNGLVKWDDIEVALTEFTEGPTAANIEIGTLLSQRTKQGRVELALNGQQTQMDLDKAREVRDMLNEAIEAAISDELLFAFMTTKVGLDENRAAQALLDFRELRQGTRQTVYPQ